MSILTKKIRIISLLVMTVAIAISLTVTYVIVTPSSIGKVLAIVGAVLALGGFTAWTHPNRIEQFFQRLK